MTQAERDPPRTPPVVALDQEELDAHERVAGQVQMIAGRLKVDLRITDLGDRFRFDGANGSLETRRQKLCAFAVLLINLLKVDPTKQTVDQRREAILDLIGEACDAYFQEFPS